MKYNELYDDFRKYFPEDVTILNGKANQLAVEPSDGMHVVFGMIVVPFVLNLIEEKNEGKVKVAFDFFEKMAVSDDSKISEVLEFTVLEELILHDKETLNYCKKYMGNETLKSCQIVEQNMM